MEKVFFRIESNLKKTNGKENSLPFCVLKHCENYRDKKRYLESISAWLLLDEVLKKTLNKTLFDFDITFSANGKPQFNNIFVSISHTENYSAVCVSNKPVGIDIEEIKERKNLNEIAKKIFEKNIENKEEFFKFWTQKESVVKLLDLEFFDKKETKIKNLCFKSFQFQKNYVTIASKNSFELREI